MLFPRTGATGGELADGVESGGVHDCTPDLGKDFDVAVVDAI
jgi:hypothetical protein